MPSIAPLSTPSQLVLRTVEGTLYDMDTSLLSRNSELFVTILSLQQACSPTENVVDIWESDATFQDFVPLLQGKSIPPSTSFRDLSSLLSLAEKWDCPEIICRIRQSPPLRSFLVELPLHSFALARHFDWTDEARIASTASLSLDFNHPHTTAILNQMLEQDIQALQNLRRARYHTLKQMLDSPHRFPTGNGAMYFCDNCCQTHSQDDSWRTLKRKLLFSIRQVPCGSSILSWMEGKDAWGEAEKCWSATCLCSAPRFDRKTTLDLIQACLHSLPYHIVD